MTLLLLSAVGGLALSMAYGIEIKDMNDPLIELAERAIKTLAMAANIGEFLVNLIPILKYIPEFVPGAEFKKKARIWRKIQEDFRERPYSTSIEAMVCVFCYDLHCHCKLLFRAPAGLDPHSYQWLSRMSTEVVILITNKR